MKPNQFYSAHKGRVPGFALIVTLTLMVLIAILALGLLSLSSVALRSSSHQSADGIARANARMALVVAIAELQKNAGPDQRVTGRADLIDESSPNPMWTAVWNSEGGEPAYLVSGNEHLAFDLETLPSAYPTDFLKPDTNLDSENSVQIFGSELPVAEQVRAPLVKVGPAKGNGAYAWWVGDEGLKARIDLQAPDDRESEEDDEREVLALSPLEPGLSSLGDGFPEGLFGKNGSVRKTTLVTLPTTSIAASEPSLGDAYFHSLTTGGFGLPVNVRDGGMKTDLSLVFDRSQQTNTSLLNKAMGAVPVTPNETELKRLNDAKAYDFQISDRSRFQLGETFSNAEAGPNLGILYNFSRLWENFESNNSFRSLTAIPRVESELRYENTAPYDATSGGTFQNEKPHLNSPVSVVPYLVQMSFRLGAELTTPPNPLPSGTTSSTKFYKPTLEMKPVLGFWNPYNVKIKARKYRMDWSISPYMRFAYGKQPLKAGENQVAYIYLRTYWGNSGGGAIPTDADPRASSWIRLQTPTVDFEPGEFRIFSSTTVDNLASVNTIRPGWNEAGAIKIDLLETQRSSNTKKEVKVPEEHVGWFGDVFLQDSHHADTKLKFPALTSKSAMAWFTLKDVTSDEAVIIRQTNVWNGGAAGEQVHQPGNSSVAKPFVPERIVSEWNGAGTNKPLHSMKELADGNDVAPIGTWAFYLRNSSEIEDAGSGQTLRGWVDTNPRTLVGSARFDGLDASGSDLKGWNFSSQYMGGSLSPNGSPYSYGDAGDGAGGFRGLVAEAGIGNHEPQMELGGGRFRGYGGPSNTANGQTHVILFDVPRTPPISIGQLQHAHLSRYNYEPSFAVGLSYANTRIPLDKRVAKDFKGVSGMNLYDIAYEVNEGLWDEFFFSSLGIDYKDTGSSPPTSFDDVFGSGVQTLPNPRMIYRPSDDAESIDGLIASSGDRAAEAVASRTFVKGAFNLNSTSVTAWKAILSSMGASELPVLDLSNGSSTWANPDGIRFSRVSHSGTEDSYESKDGGDDAAFWRGWRELSKDELDTLATNIVAEVRKRGPFRSMADFVNRDLDGSEAEQQRGALQAALDLTLNDSLPESAALPATTANGGAFHAPPADSNQGGGQAGYLMQGDLLQSLGPILQARSDYFKIRAYGEAHDPEGNVIAKAWCEATVQRQPEYVSPENEAFESEARGDTLATINKAMGRRFKITRFRWLSPTEI